MFRQCPFQTYSRPCRTYLVSPVRDSTHPARCPAPSVKGHGRAPGKDMGDIVNQLGGGGMG